MPQPRRGLVPEAGVDVPKVRPQGVMSTRAQYSVAISGVISSDIGYCDVFVAQEVVRPTAAWRWDMKAICLRARGGPEALAYEEAPQSHPGEGEVLVRVHAAGVIHDELSWVPTWTTRAGEPRPLPVIPGHEFSGEIAALGAGVRDVGVGDLVYGLNDWYRDGASAEYGVAPVADIAHKPAGVDHVHAAATPISALTAWQGLVERAGLAAGQRGLIHGAAGGVGTFAVQLAR